MLFNLMAYPLEQFDVLSFSAFNWEPFFPTTNVGIFFTAAMLVLLVFVVTGFHQTNLTSRPLYFLSSAESAIFAFFRTFFKENLIIKKNVFFFAQLAQLLIIMGCNVFGMIPYSVTVTSFFAFTLFFSGVVFFAGLTLGLYFHRYVFFSLFIPAGTPTVLKAPLVSIELLSYIARLFSLSIRLFANMVAGHALLKILYGFVWAFMHLSLWSLVASVISAIIVSVMTVLEFLIALLQAYVFSVLTSIYLNEATNLH